MRSPIAFEVTLVSNHRGIVTPFSCNISDFHDDYSRSMSLSNGHSSWKRIFLTQWKEISVPLGRTLNLKQSDIKSNDTPRALSGSRKSHSTSSDFALLSASVPSITSFELLTHFVKLNAAAIMMSDISCWSFSAEFSVLVPAKQSSTYKLCRISLVTRKCLYILIDVII